MSISNNIKSSILLLENNDTEGALALIVNAIDATGKKRYPKETTKKRTQYFIKDMQSLILKTTLGGSTEILGNISFDRSGYRNLNDIIYHLIRCNLTHEASLPNGIKFRRDLNGIGLEEEKVILGYMFVWGMLLSVISSKENKTEKIVDGKCMINFKKGQINVNKLWGREEKIRKLLEENNN